jgi:SAM-dependent methyltransferase
MATLNAITLPARRTNAPVPEYAEEMKHFHCAFAAELKAVVDSLPLTPDMHVIDVGCGDGFYMELLASRLNQRGKVTGFDRNRGYLKNAKRRLARRNWLCEIRFINGSWDDPPVPDGGADFVWSAQSLFSLPEPTAALREMSAAVRPGGFVAVLENDTLHQLMLPWSPQLELAVRAAELACLFDEQPSAEKYYVARRLPALFADAGLEPLGVTMQCISRRPPFGEHLMAFLQSYLDRLAQRVEERLDPALALEFAQLTDRESDSQLLRQPGAMIGWLNTIAWGRRPVST